ncbi:MAG: hypothetical protein JW936_07980 [Sedimentisphaerales bacterium]|nr:hypothetical protein [Sedimentisphaerales bacterium]
MTQRQYNSLIWIAITVAALMVLLGVAIVVFRRLFGPNRTYQDHSTTFTLADIEKMKDQGQISAEEYEGLKAQIIQESQK